MIKYSDLLKHPKWQKKRLKILESRGWMCEACSEDDETLHVHHKKYIHGNKPWEYDDNDLVVLCENCHFDVELLKLQKKHDKIIQRKLKEWMDTDEFKELEKEYKMANTQNRAS